MKQRIAVLLLILFGAVTKPIWAVTLYIDHMERQPKIGNLNLEVGDHVSIVIENTRRDCFTYNGVGVTDDTTITSEAETQPADLVRLGTLIHREEVRSYRVTITKNDASCQETELDNLVLDIPVTQVGWKLGFNGAFVLSQLTNSVFFLETGMNEGQDGFFVRRNAPAEDDTTSDLAMMVHLYNDSWRLRRGFRWAPLSFGLNLQDNTSYLVGTSLQFGNKAFLTLGKAFGKVNRLPNSVSLGDFTTNANAIDTLGEKREDAWFLSFSYEIGNLDVESRFSQIFSGGSVEEPKPMRMQIEENPG